MLTTKGFIHISASKNNNSEKDTYNFNAAAGFGRDQSNINGDEHYYKWKLLGIYSVKSVLASELSIDLGEAPNGIYIVYLIANNGKISRTKVVKD